MQPCEAAYPGSGPPCSATPFQVMRCMFGIQASSYMVEWWSFSFSTTANTPAGVSRSLTPVDTGARRIQPSASYKVTCCVLIDTIAMIGSPASRGAVASLGGAGRGSLAAALGLNAVSAAIAARLTTAGSAQRPIAKVDCTVVNRFTMPCLVGMLSAFASIECQIEMYTTV